MRVAAQNTLGIGEYSDVAVLFAMDPPGTPSLSVIS